MDGLDTADTDNSQDEGKFKKYGRNLSVNGVVDKSPHFSAVGQGVGRLNAAAAAAAVDTSFVTTDDESVGQLSPNARNNKLRRPRAKPVQTNPSLLSSQQPNSPRRTANTTTADSAAHSASVHHTPDRADLRSKAAHNTPTEPPTLTTESAAGKLELHLSDGESSLSAKPKRRSRANASKAKADAVLSNSVEAAPVDVTAATAASSGPWDGTLDQWYACDTSAALFSVPLSICQPHLDGPKFECYYAIINFNDCVLCLFLFCASQVG